ncbi:MAG: CHASE2 domain-containing protein [Bryobacteraceae bacterium]
MLRFNRQNLGYAVLLVLLFVIAMMASYTAFGRQIDADAYDWTFRLHRGFHGETRSALLAIDEASLMELGGVRGLRSMVAGGLERLSAASPSVVAIDLTLSEAGDPADDRRLALAMRNTPNLVLAAEMMPGAERWQEPWGEFRRLAAGIGHVHAAPDELDGVNRQVPLEKVAGHERHWALSFEAYRLSRGGARVIESPEDLRVGSTVIPAAREASRAMFVRYLPTDANGVSTIPRVSLRDLIRNPALAERFRGRAVFIGVTAESAARDRLMTPVSSMRPMPGVEIHANAFETLSHGRFLTAAPDATVALACILIVVSAGLIFAFVTGWKAYLLGALLLLVALVAPYALFSGDFVFPFTAPVTAAWLSFAGAASYQHFVVRRRLQKAEADRTRYQQAMHFVTHEMRTPLTAIQGSSELMTRYNLTGEKQKQMAGLIHTESRRLAKMVETFLNVERLSAGQIELSKEPFPSRELVETCVERARPLAERKQISLQSGGMDDGTLVGDRELMEYAVYNLINNAIKYSPASTEVTVLGRRDGGFYRLSVSDQGYGMDQKELQNIFRKFYRTRDAIASGEAGTGVGLSIVEQIVTHHGGRIEVTSEPGKGSCFTLVVPAAVTEPADGRRG